MSPMERLKELVGRLNAHIERLDVDGAQPDNRMTYDDLGDIAEVLKALASDDAVERMARANYERSVKLLVRPGLPGIGWDDLTDQQRAIAIEAESAALSAILSDVLGEE